MFSSQPLRNDYFVRNQKIISPWLSEIIVIIESAYQFGMDIKLSYYSTIAHPVQFNTCGALLYLHNNEIKQYFQPDWQRGKELAAYETVFSARLGYCMNWLNIQNLVLISIVKSFSKLSGFAEQTSLMLSFVQEKCEEWPFSLCSGPSASQQTQQLQTRQKNVRIKNKIIGIRLQHL